MVQASHSGSLQPLSGFYEVEHGVGIISVLEAAAGSPGPVLLTTSFET